MHFILEVLLLKLLILPILSEATNKNSCFNGYFFKDSSSDSKCLPCQKENIVYFGNNLECCAPILKSLTLENCQDECDSHSQCYSWSYHITSKKCYLKNQENYQNFVLNERYTKQDEYISGVKHCDPMEEEISRNNNNLRVFIHGHQLKALYANFGRQIHPGIKIKGDFKNTNNKNESSLFCSIIPYNSKNVGNFAVVNRGGCEFLTKALFAQTAGYAGLIVLDTKINTEFKRIVYGNNRRAFFVRIPVVFVLKPDADVISKLPHGSYPVTLQNERPVKFRPMWTKNSLENNGAASRNSTTKSLPEKIREQFKSLSFLSWITLGCGFLAILIVASAFFVCCVSCCSNKRRPSRITPDVDCGHGTYLPHTTQPSSAILHQITSYNISNSVPFVSSHCNYDRNSITAEESVDLSCPICFEVPLPPKKIFQCSQGHTICDTCLDKMTGNSRKCPSCREDWSNNSRLPVRNRMAETMLSNYFGVNQNLSRSSSMADLSVNNAGFVSMEQDIYAPSAPPLP